MTNNTDPRVLILAPGDNVAIAKTDIAAGTALTVMGATITLKSAEETGHKFAFKPVKRGETIVKYGAPIGVATADIAPGDSMHIHNVQRLHSDLHPRRGPPVLQGRALT